MNPNLSASSRRLKKSWNPTEGRMIGGTVKKISSTELTGLLLTGHSKSPGRLIKELVLNTNQQQRVHLGRFAHTNPPNGFIAEVEPDPNPVGSVVTEVVDAGTDSQYDLSLLVANYSISPVTVRVLEIVSYH